MAVYKEQTVNGTSSIKLHEVPIYGSDRMGMWKPGGGLSNSLVLEDEVQANQLVNTYDGTSYKVGNEVELTLQPGFVFEAGVDGNIFSVSNTGQATGQLDNKLYELKDHLGNIRAVVTDRKQGDVSGGTPQDIKPTMASATAYYPYGMDMPCSMVCGSQNICSMVCGSPYSMVCGSQTIQISQETAILAIMNEPMSGNIRNSKMFLGEVYFWTDTVKDWKLLLKQDKYKQLIIDQLKDLAARKFVVIYGFVIMPNHLHLVWELVAKNGKEMPNASFNKAVGHGIIKDLKQNHPLVLPYFEVEEKERKYRIWQRDPLAILMDSRKKMEQKLDYIHANPLHERWNLAVAPEDYPWSSAKFYEKGVDDFDFLTHYMERF